MNMNQTRMVLFDKLRVASLNKKLAILCGTRRFI